MTFNDLRHFAPRPSALAGPPASAGSVLDDIRAVLVAGGGAVGRLRLGSWWIERLEARRLAPSLCDIAGWPPARLTVYGVEVVRDDADPYAIEPEPIPEAA